MMWTLGGRSSVGYRSILLSQQLRAFSSTGSNLYLAAPDRKVRVRVVSNKKKNGKPSRGPGTHMTFKEMTTKLNLNKDAPVLDLPQLDASSVEVGKLYLYSNIKELHHLGSFNKYQYNELWKSPFSIARESTTLPILKFYEKSSQESSANNRMIILGETGVGKTTLISQLQSFAKSQNSIVISFNDCSHLINGTTDYVFDPESGLYHQPMYLNRLFNRLKRSNATEFAGLKLSKAYKFLQYSASTKNSLLDLINIGKKLKGPQKFLVWNLLIEELKIQQTHPVFLTVDNFSLILKRPFTNYRNTENNFIYFDQFTFGKFIIDHISGSQVFNKGGVLVGTSGGRQKKTLNVALGFEPFDPYLKVTDFDAKLATYLDSNLQVLNVPKFNKEELKVLLDKLLQNDVLKNDDLSDEEKILNGKYILSGNGNPREFYRACVLNYY